MIGGQDGGDVGWVKGVDTNNSLVGNGWDDGEEGRRRN